MHVRLWGTQLATASKVKDVDEDRRVCAQQTEVTLLQPTPLAPHLLLKRTLRDYGREDL